MGRYLGTNAAATSVFTNAAAGTPNASSEQIAVGDALTEASGAWTLVGAQFYNGGELQVSTYDGHNVVSAHFKTQYTSGQAFLCFDLDTPLSGARWAEVTVRMLNRVGGTSSGWRLRACTETGMAGDYDEVVLTGGSVPIEGTTGDGHRTLRLPLKTIGQVASIGIGTVAGTTTGSNRQRWGIWDVKTVPSSRLDDTMATAAADATVLVAADYVAGGTQQPIPPSELTRGVLDLRPDFAVVGRHHGRYLVREARLAEDGSRDVAGDLQAYIDSVPDQSTIEFPAGAAFRLDTPVEFVGRRQLDIVVPYDTRFFQNALKNQTMWRFQNSKLLRWTGGQHYGLPYPAGYNGSGLTDAGGSPTLVDTTKTLAASGDAVQAPVKSNGSHAWLARNHNGQITFDVTLSDSNQVAGDVVLSFERESDGLVLETSTVTCTATPTTYTLTHTLHHLDANIRCKVAKATAAANTVTVHSAVQHGRIRYDANYPFGHIFQFEENCKDIDVGFFHAEAFAGDAVVASVNDPDAAPGNVRFHHFVSRGCGRQGISWNGGDACTFESFVVRECARSGIDIEPLGTMQVRDLAIRNGLIVNAQNNGFASLNWNGIYNMEVSNLTIRDVGGDGLYSFEGGAIGGTISIRSIMDAAGRDELPDVRIRGGRSVIYDLQVSQGVQAIAADEYLTGGGNIIKRLTVTAPSQGVPLVDNSGQPDLVVRDVVVAGYDANATTYDSASWGFQTFRGTWNSATMVHHQPAINNLPQTFKSTAVEGLWFPRGLDLLDEPVTQARSLSGGTVKGNNLAGSASVTAAASTVTVTFPTWEQRTGTAFPNPGTVGAGVAQTYADPAALGAGTYQYAVASMPPSAGGPNAPSKYTSEVTVSGAANGVGFNLQGLLQPASGVMINDLAVYRRTAPAAAYTVRWLIRADTVFTSYRHPTPSPGNVAFVSLNDIGPVLTVNEQTGFPTSVAGDAGTWDPPVDETGWEPDTDYAVLVETDWDAGGWWVTAKAQSGFTINFSNAAPGGGGTARWMIVRS